jgi:uncharacterized protein YndB with AHSA1/START domain
MSTHSRVTDADGTLKDSNGQQVIRFQRRISHPVERVWAALTEPKELFGWLGEAEVDLVVGGRFDITWLNAGPGGERFTRHATITRLEPPRLLESSGDNHGILRWELLPDGDGTLLTFSSTLDLPDEYRSVTMAGWHYHLDALAAILDGASVDLVNLPNGRWEELNRQYGQRLP